MKDTKRIVWTNDPCLLDEDEDDVCLEDQLSDERCNLNIDLGQPILVVASLGLWNGRRTAYKEIKSGNLKDCLYSECDYDTWYVDTVTGEFACNAIHHDGTNRYRYRVFKDGVSDRVKENVKERIYSGTITDAYLNRFTKRLGDIVRNVYGW